MSAFEYAKLWLDKYFSGTELDPFGKRYNTFQPEYDGSSLTQALAKSPLMIVRTL